MPSTYEKIEQCTNLASSQAHDAEEALLSLLRDEEWRVRYAAAVAAGDRRNAEFVGPLVELLAEEDAAPLYKQPEVEAGGHAGATEVRRPSFPPGTTEAMMAAWQRRGRIKQAVCLALGQIGDSSDATLSSLHRYATDQSEDYTVRAAACLALGQIAAPQSAPFLQQATKDEEFCTSTEATKALASVVGA